MPPDDVVVVESTPLTVAAARQRLAKYLPAPADEKPPTDSPGVVTATDDIGELLRDEDLRKYLGEGQS